MARVTAFFSSYFIKPVFPRMEYSVSFVRGQFYKRKFLAIIYMNSVINKSKLNVICCGEYARKSYFYRARKYSSQYPVLNNSSKND